MCIIIVNKHNRLKKSIIKNCAKSNPDGFGLMYCQNNKINVYKTLDDINQFYKVYSGVRNDNKNINIVLHFRIGTSGLVDLNNIHPFSINKNLYFCHNGIINIDMLKNSKISDTIVFNEKILKKLPNNFLNNKAIIRLIEKYVSGSKLVFLDSNNKVTIINEHLGNFDKFDNWYSNYSYSNYYGFNYSCEFPSGNKEKNTNNEIIEGYEQDDCYNYTCLLCGDYLFSENEYENQVCNNCIFSNRLTKQDIQTIKLSYL